MKGREIFLYKSMLTLSLLGYFTGCTCTDPKPTTPPPDLVTSGNGSTSTTPKVTSTADSTKTPPTVEPPKIPIVDEPPKIPIVDEPPKFPPTVEPPKVSKGGALTFSKSITEPADFLLAEQDLKDMIIKVASAFDKRDLTIIQQTLADIKNAPTSDAKAEIVNKEVEAFSYFFPVFEKEEFRNSDKEAKFNIFKTLIENGGPGIIEKRFKDNETLLYRAVESDNIDLVEYLIYKGADKKGSMKPASNKWTLSEGVRYNILLTESPEQERWQAILDSLII